MKTAREMLAELEQLALKGDELMTRLVADLGDYHADLEALMRAASLARSTSSAVIVEAACILTERERGEPVIETLRRPRLQ